MAIFIEAPINQSFVMAVQKIGQVKIFSKEDQEIFKQFPRLIDLKIGYDLYEECQKLSFDTPILIVKEELLFLPEAIAILLNAARSKLYCSPLDSTVQFTQAVACGFVGGRHWVLGVEPKIKTFAVQNGVFLEDKDMWTQFENIWSALETIQNRKIGIPVPSLCSSMQIRPQGINWAQLQELMKKA